MKNVLWILFLPNIAWGLTATNVVSVDFDKEMLNGVEYTPTFYKVDNGSIQYREVVGSALSVFAYSPCPNGFNCVSCDVSYSLHSPTKACLDGNNQEDHTFDSSATAVSDFPNIYYQTGSTDGQAFFSIGDSAKSKDRNELYLNSSITNDQIYRLDFRLHLRDDDAVSGIHFPNYDPNTPLLGEYDSSNNREWFMIMQARQTGPTDGSPVLSLNLVRGEDSKKYLEVVAREREPFFTTAEMDNEHRTCGEDEQNGDTEVYNSEGELVSHEVLGNGYYWGPGDYRNCPKTERKTLIKWNIGGHIGSWKNLRLEYRLGEKGYVGLYIDLYSNGYYRQVGEIGHYKNEYGNDVWRNNRYTSSPSIGHVEPLPGDWLGSNKLYLGKPANSDSHVLKLGIYRGAGQFRNGIPREAYIVGFDDIHLSTLNP